MNSKLKKLEELEKLLPAKPCTHPGIIVQHEGESSEEVTKILQEMESCPRCQRSGAKLIVIRDYST